MFSALLTRSLRVAAASVGLVSLAVHAASIDPALQKSVRAATYEVVLPRPATDPLTYERALPLELLPYAERTDRFHSLGTAFSISPGVYVSAAHVMTAGIGSEFGAPALRLADGSVHSVDKVLKFSQHEDFMVFTVSPGVAGGVLPTSRTPAIDEAVYSVGNAQGEGVVIRDGLLTSMTPEDQDGRWKWLRFSAATSPGNSGGPLLDARGRVVGVVVARSAGENLNYALPIERVLNADADAARYDVRAAFELPMLVDTRTATLAANFPLPLGFDEFARRHQALQLRHFREQRDGLLADAAAHLFPRGDAARVLTGAERSTLPSLVVEGDDHAWHVLEGGKAEATSLPGDGAVSMRMARGVGLFLLSRGDELRDDAFYADSTAFMDTLLKGVKLTRSIGTQAIRIRSAGPAQTESLHSDAYGRRWQIRRWPLAYTQAVVTVAALPTPTGYVGMVRMSPAADAEESAELLRTLTTYFQSPLEGTMRQWQTYLAREQLRAASFDDLHIEHAPATGFRFESARLQAVVPNQLLKVSDAGWLRLDMAFIAQGGRTRWDVAGLTLAADRAGDSFLALTRRMKPAADGGRDDVERWQRMLAGKDEFDGVTARDPEQKAASVRFALARTDDARGRPAPQSAVLYETFYRTTDRLSSGEMDARRSSMTRSLRVLEE